MVSLKTGNANAAVPCHKSRTILHPTHLFLFGLFAAINRTQHRVNASNAEGIGANAILALHKGNCESY